jgi:hypothetical protein
VQACASFLLWRAEFTRRPSFAGRTRFQVVFLTCQLTDFELLSNSHEYSLSLDWKILIRGPHGLQRGGRGPIRHHLAGCIWPAGRRLHTGELMNNSINTILFNDSEIRLIILDALNT